MSYLYFMRISRVLFLFAIASLPISPALGISRTDFFERLDRSMAMIQTFESNVQQESRYSDGKIERYSGHLTLFDDGRIAYRYDLVAEYDDPSLIPDSQINQSLTGTAPSGSHRAPSSGRYLAKQGRVRHYDADRNLATEGTEDSNLLIQVFRTLVGSEEFDVEKFKEENSIDVEETSLDGIPVYRMVATPKKKSELFKRWSSQTRNEMANWNWELWVKQANMEPMKAVLQSIDLGESTTIHLNGTQINQPVDEGEFTLPAGTQVIPKQGFGTPPSRAIEEIRTLEAEPAGLREIPTE